MLSSRFPLTRLTTAPAIFLALIVVSMLVGLLTTPADYEGVRDERVFTQILGMFRSDVFGFIAWTVFATVLGTAALLTVAVLIFRGFGIQRRGVQLGILLGGAYLFLLGSCLRAPALFEETLLRLPLLHGRLVYTLAHIPGLAQLFCYGGVFGVPLAGLVLLGVALVKERRWALLGLGAVAVVLLASPHVRFHLQLRAIGSGPTYAATSNKKSSLVIALDSLRPDFVDGTGDRAVAAPNLSALRARSLFFPETIVSIARTGPSLTSMFRSQYPMKTGISTMFPEASEWKQSDFSAARLFASSGYETFAVSDYVGEFLSKVNLGFDSVSVPTVELPQIAKGRILAHQPWLLALLTHPVIRAGVPSVFEEILLGYTHYSDPHVTLRTLVAKVANADAARKPFFGFLFLSPPHFPYASIFPHYVRDTRLGYSGPYRFQKAYTSSTTTVEDQRQIRGLYAGALSMSDALVGKVVAVLERRKVGITITGDHGELLYDQPDVAMGHGDLLRYSHAYTVPLYFFDTEQKWPRGTDAAYARSIDVMPTLVDLLRRHDQVQFRIPRINERFNVESQWDGISLVNRDLAARKERPWDFDSLAYSETELWMTADATGTSPRIAYPGITELLHPDAAHGHRLILKPEYRSLVNHAKYRMLRSNTLKFVTKPTPAGPVEELFDLAVDPLEKKNLIGEQPALAGEFRRALKKILLGYREGYLFD